MSLIRKGGSVNLRSEEWQVYLALEAAGPTWKAQLPDPPPPWAGEIYGLGLSRPETAALRKILEKRRSSRVLWKSLTLATLLEILGLALERPKDRPKSRVYPTSGGCDELGVLVIARNVRDLPAAAYWATGGDADGLKIAASLEHPDYIEFERSACVYWGLPANTTPAAMLLLMADWRVLAARYINCMLASALLDCGTLLQTLSLAAAAVGTNACIGACIRPTLVGSWLGLDCGEFGHVGTLALGGGKAKKEDSVPRITN